MNKQNRKFVITDIKYDTDGKKVKGLPKELNIDIPDYIEDDDIDGYISDEISNITGYCHFGFVTNPEIKS